MKLPQKIKWIIFFAFILLIGIICNIVVESAAYKRGGLHFGVTYIGILLMAITGYSGWRVLHLKEVAKIWIIIYLGVFIISCAVKMLNSFAIGAGLNHFFIKIDMLFISPLPFVSFYFLLKHNNKTGSRAVKTKI